MSERSLIEFVHPAIWLLFKLQIRGRWSNTKAFLLSGKKCWPMLFATALLIWVCIQQIVQAVATRSISTELLQDRLAIMMLVVFLWRAVKSVFQTPTSADHWPPVEASLIRHAPFSSYDRVIWRIFRNATSTLAKATIVTLMLATEVESIAFAWIGFALSFITLDMFGYSWEKCLIIFEGKKLWLVRVSILVTGCVILAVLGRQQSIVELVQTWSPMSLFGIRPEALVDVGYAAINESNLAFILWPTKQFATLVTTQGINIASMSAFLNCWIVTLSGITAAWIVENCGETKETAKGQAVTTTNTRSKNFAKPRYEWNVPYLQGIGPIAWRQCLRLRNDFHSTIWACLPIIAVSILPTKCCVSDNQSFLGVSVVLAILSLLILPAVFRFDFRNDFDHLCLMKQLAVSPVSVVLGQMFVPVVGLLALQGIVLGASLFLVQVDWPLLVIVLVTFPLIDVLIIGFENFVYLASPHRFGDSGLATAIRTLISFTAKLIAIGFLSLSMLILMHTVQQLSELANLSQSFANVCLGVGSILLFGVIAILLVIAMQRRFVQLDCEML